MTSKTPTLANQANKQNLTENGQKNNKEHLRVDVANSSLKRKHHKIPGVWDFMCIYSLSFLLLFLLLSVLAIKNGLGLAWLETWRGCCCCCCCCCCSGKHPMPAICLAPVFFGFGPRPATPIPKRFSHQNGMIFPPPWGPYWAPREAYVA